jgi:hypothetical protein
MSKSNAILKKERPRTDELAELLAAASRVLPEYSDKLDSLVQNTVTLWQHSFRQTSYPPQLTDEENTLVKVTLKQRASEMSALEDPLGYWIDKLSAVLEEGPITEVERGELRLRLTELEVKYQTALEVFKTVKSMLKK